MPNRSVKDERDEGMIDSAISYVKKAFTSSPKPKPTAPAEKPKVDLGFKNAVEVTKNRPKTLEDRIREAGG